MNRSESIGAIAKALVKAQSTMGNAVKGAANPFFKSKFADLNSIREACMPILNENGITVLQGTTVHEGKPYVETSLVHESGEFISSLTEIIAPKANDPQAHGSGVSYARRYGLQSLLCIGAEDDDGEKAMGRNTQAAKPVAPAKTQAVNHVAEETKEIAPPRKGFGVAPKPKVETIEETKGSEDGWE